MRTPLATLAAAAVAAGALTLAPSAPAQAAEWTHTDDITATANTSVSSRVIDVVAYGDGFAAAVWFDDGNGTRRVMASRFRPNVGDGEWDPAVAISTAGRYAYDPVVSVNSGGDLVAAWTEPHDGVEELYAAVQPVAGAWAAPVNLTPGATNVINGIDVGIADDRTVYAAAEYKDADDANFGLRVVEWDYPAAPTAPLTVTAHGGEPALDVSGSGEVILAFKNDALFKYAYTRHSDGGAWTAVQQVGASTTASPAAAVDDAGRAAIAFTNDTGSAVQVQLVDPSGAKHGAATTLSAVPAPVTPSVDVNDGGRVLAAWTDANGGDPVLGHATSAFGGAWAIDEQDAPLAGVGQVETAVAASGAQAIGYAYDGRQVVLHRAQSSAGFTGWVSPAAYADHQAVSIDGVGNVVALGALTGSDSALHARYLDTVGPATAITGFPAQVTDSGLALTPSVPVTADGHDWLSGLSSVDVVVRVARWNRTGYGPRTVAMDDQPADSPLPFAPQPGRSYCLAVRGTDGAGNLGAVTPERCFTAPLDDRALQGAGWQRTQGGAHYRGTATTTKAEGRTLVRRGVRARHLALVVAKAPNAGRVQVRLGRRLLGTYSLKGNGTEQVIDIATFAKTRKGTLRITVVSKGKPVRIDGVVIAK